VTENTGVGTGIGENSATFANSRASRSVSAGSGDFANRTTSSPSTSYATLSCPSPSGTTSR
jgi:hypothetical protein